MRIKSIATEPGDIRAILGAEMRARPPPLPTPQLVLDFAAG